MIILFEDYNYPKAAIEAVLPDDLLSFSSGKKSAKTTFVGYHYSEEVSEAVFILPKVFVDSSGHPFGQENLTRESFLTDCKPLDEILGETDAQIVSRLSFWLYMAIARYAERHSGTDVLLQRNIQDIKSVGEYDSATLIEIIQSLRKFNRDHQALFTFIANYNRSGVNKIHWNKTVSTVLPFLQDGEPVYLDFVNKKKNINYDEEIIVLFYSVLEYLKDKYYFDDPINLNFNLIPPHRIEGMIEAEMGTILLDKIRHKYFTDELVQLWQLLYVFFEKSEKIANKGYVEEYVLAKSFNNVFEDMVDQLIGSDELSSLKKNKDGKIIDHLYRDRSIFNDGEVYYIADSKYYKESSDLGETAVYKQFTYARNIIQHNLNLFQRNPKASQYLPAMRDELTEGYNVIPNFFIRGSALDENGLYDYETDGVKNEFDSDRKDASNKLVNYHFPNRLFDRDTLILQTYNINFLYVLAKYVEGGDDVAKARIRKKFREYFICEFDKLYAFYKLTPKEGKTIEEVVEENFQKLLGKAMRLSNDNDSLLFAWEKSMLTDKTTDTVASVQACELYLKGLKDVEYCPITLAEMNDLK